MMHQQSMMVGDMLPVHSDMPVNPEEINNMNNIGYENSVGGGSHAYDDLFPALPHSQPPVQRNIQQVTNKLRVGSTLHTQVFHVPYEERKLDNANTFGEGESLRTCQAITKETGAHIEISTSKDGSLTFLLTGKHSAVLEARRQILTHFQQQASKQITIPKEHYRWILGKQGAKLKELERVTATKISVPAIADSSEVITITGTKEGIEKAEHEIRVCSEEQSRKALERITVPKIYHPFIIGPYGERLAAMTAETGARVHIPPASTQSEEIVVAGEKNGVLAAKAQIQEIYDEMKKKISTVRVEVPKSQHKYVIGARGTTIQEILKETGVSVEMPPPDSTTGTITLHGPHNKIGLALSKVCEKANSVKTATVDAPTWIHKYIIGKNGSNIKKITQDFSKVHVDITHSEDKVKIDGPPEEVERAQVELDLFVKNLLATLTYVELTVDPKYFKHIIGKSGTNINRLKDETGVVININESDGNNIIRIEGSHDGVANAERELRSMVMKLENERSKEVYVDHRYIKALIGVRGEKIKEIREKFDRVLINLPDQNQKRSPIKLRGPQEDVDKCEKYLHKVLKEIAELSYVQEVPIFKQFHKFIIGKGGVNLRKIRDETQTIIDLPAEGDDSDVITVRGKRENVEDAVRRIQQIHTEKANIVTEEVTIPSKYYNSLIGAGGKLIHSIMEDCGGVLIKFPPADSDSDKVVVKGPVEDVEKAVQQLLAHANERELTSHTAQVYAKPEHHKFLIGKNGANIKKIREQTGARIVFPSEKDEDKEAIFIIGREEQVAAAKTALSAAVAEISAVSEGEMTVPSRHHRHFVARRGEVLRRIADECGGVQISFPRQGVDSERVVLKGPKECIEAAKTRIDEIIEDLEAKVTIECVISQRHHRTVMGARGSKVKDITAEFDVQIKFPERDTNEGADIPLRNGDDEPGPNDVIKITGRPENCEAAKKALLEQVNSSKHTGAGSEDVYVPSLWYYDALTFLGCTTESCRPITDSIENVADENENLSSSEGESSQAGPSSAGSSVAAKKKKRSILQKQENILASAEKLMCMKEEEWEVLGKSIGLQLRDLKSRDLTIAQKLIGDVIFYAKMGRLSEDARIDLGSDRSSSSSWYFNHDQHRSKLSHPSPRCIVLSPSPSPQYHSSSPQYRVNSPNPSPHYHNTSPQYRVQSPNAPIPSPNYYNTSPQYRVQSPNTSHTPQIHIPESSHTAQIHIPESSHTPQIHVPESSHTPQIHIPESSHTPQIHIPESSYTPQIHIPESSHTPQIHIPEPGQLHTYNNTAPKINIQEYLIFNPNK